MPKSQEIYESTGVTRAERFAALGHRGATLWFTGLSGSGKSTISIELERRLLSQKSPRLSYRLDGDNLRFGLNSDLGFSPEDRKENTRRVAEAAKLFADAGLISLVGLISPYAVDRAYAREVHANASLPFFEVFVDAPLSVVEERDPKGLYKKARAGVIRGFTGLDAPYEKPEQPDIRIASGEVDVAGAVDQIMAVLERAGVALAVSDAGSTTGDAGSTTGDASSSDPRAQLV